jgi:hypothetical protein
MYSFVMPSSDSMMTSKNHPPWFSISGAGNGEIAMCFGAPLM